MVPPVRRSTPAEVVLKRLGPWISMIGVLATAGVIGLLATALCGDAERYDWDDYWENAAYAFILTAPVFLAAGLTVSALPEVFHAGPVAARFARAARRSLGVRPGLLGLVVWILLLASGLLAFGYCLLALIVDNNLYRNDLAEGTSIIGTVAAFVLSVLLPVVTAASAAVSMSASRRSGGARDLLMGPLTAAHLGRATVLAHARRACGWLLAALPLYGLAVMLFAMEWDNDSEVHGIALFMLIMLLLAVIEVLALFAAAALGTWLGAAVPVPAAAGMLAAALAFGLWIARAMGMGLCAAVGQEMWRDDAAEFWSWIWLALAGCWFASVLVTGLGLGLVRGSLALPLAVRLGAWLIHNGEKLVWLAGERSEMADEVRLWSATGTGSVRSGAGWKLGTAGSWLIALGMLVLVAVTGGLAGDGDTRSWAVPVFWGGWALACGLVVGVRLLAGYLGRRLREGGP